MLILHFKSRPQAFRTNPCHLEHLPVAIFSKMQFIFCHGFTWATAQAAVMSHWRESPLCFEDIFSVLEVILDTRMSLTIAHFTLHWKRKKTFFMCWSSVKMLVRKHEKYRHCINCEKKLSFFKFYNFRYI